MNIAVIGAGPIGNYTAYLLSKKGFSVDVFEEHATIGKPVQCTGIVTKKIFDYINEEDYIMNELEGARIQAKNSQTTIPLKEYVIDRTKFDQQIAKMAQAEGTNIILGNKIIEISQKRIRTNKQIPKKEYEYIIGADGPNSIVSKTIGNPPAQFWIGKQARVQGKYDNFFDVELGKIPDFFAWKVPESKTTARIGMASSQSPAIRDFKIKGKIIEMQGGLIPKYTRKTIQKENLFLAGDAGGFVKATTGGGIITGLESAKQCATAISENKNYEKLLKPLRRQLAIHNIIRKTLNKFSENDYEKLIKDCESEKIKKILSEESRDFPAKMAIKVIIAKPNTAARMALKLLPF